MLIVSNKLRYVLIFKIIFVQNLLSVRYCKEPQSRILSVSKHRLFRKTILRHLETNSVTQTLKHIFEFNKCIFLLSYL